MRTVHRADKYIDLADWLCFDCENPELALEWVERALHLEPENPEALILKADILQSLGRLDQALSYYDRALEIVPDALEAIAERARVLHAVGRFEEARLGAETGLRLLREAGDLGARPDPLLELLYEIYVVSSMALGRGGEALRVSREALRYCPDSPRIRELAVLVKRSVGSP